MEPKAPVQGPGGDRPAGGSGARAPARIEMENRRGVLSSRAGGRGG